MHRHLALGLVAAALLATPSFAQAPLGTAPTYTDRKLGILPSGQVPNAAAILRRIWMPGLDEGFVPQGLSVVAGSVYVAAYKSPEGAGRGPCRLYRLHPQSGKVTGILDLPPQCGHAGGAAKGTPGHIWVADTRDIFEIRIDEPASAAIGKVVRHIRLGGLIKGSYAAGSADALWLGAYETHGAPRLYKFPWAALKPQISQEDASASVAMPVRVQGAAFDPAGRLWVSRSSGSFGELVEVKVESGAIGARYAFPVGTEDISFDADGRLWTVSEAGSKRWLSWSTFFPVVFQVDMGRLR
jgi:hypothetical protein